jgi:hypothetical protein
MAKAGEIVRVRSAARVPVPWGAKPNNADKADARDHDRCIYRINVAVKAAPALPPPNRRLPDSLKSAGEMN